MDYASHSINTGIYIQKNEALKKIAFFDFDGTITKKDSFLEFIKFSKGILSFYFGFLINSPYLVAYKLKIISNQKAKEKILQFFFQNMPFDKFQNLCNQFSEQKVPSLIRPKALEEIKKLQSNNITVVVVSASPENWIRKWTKAMQVELVATCLEIKEERLTGKISGYNCHGQEKIRRIHQQYTLADYCEIYAYGDSAGDKQMLALAHHSYMKPFR